MLLGTLDRTSIVFAVTLLALPRFFFFESKHPTGVESSLGVRVLHLVAFHLPSRNRLHVQRRLCVCICVCVCVCMCAPYVCVLCVWVNVRRHKRGLYRHMRPSRLSRRRKSGYSRRRVKTIPPPVPRV